MSLRTVVLSSFLILWGGVPLAKGEGSMMITSPDFKHQENIPGRFTCQGADVSPELQISGVPAAAKSLALIVDDPDAPVGDWVHWVLFNVDPKTSVIPESSSVGTLGWNDFGRLEWGGPCPPQGTHRYFFKLYALDIPLSLPTGAKKADVLQAMEGHILDKAELIGLYKQF